MAEEESSKKGGRKSGEDKEVLQGEDPEYKGKGKEVNSLQPSIDTVREETRVELAEHQLIGLNVDKALEYLHKTNPIEQIEKPLMDSETEIRDFEDQMHQRIQDWLGAWDKTISRGEDLPQSLIARAVELAERSREKEEGE